MNNTQGGVNPSGYGGTGYGFAVNMARVNMPLMPSSVNKYTGESEAVLPAGQAGHYPVPLRLTGALVNPTTVGYTTGGTPVQGIPVSQLPGGSGPGGSSQAIVVI